MIALCTLVVYLTRTCFFCHIPLHKYAFASYVKHVCSACTYFSNFQHMCAIEYHIAICAPLHMHGGAHVLETGSRYMHHSITCV